MFKKYSVRGKDNKALCDIQAAGAGIVAPNSVIDCKHYEMNDEMIAEISSAELKMLFKVKEFEGLKEFKGGVVGFDVAKMNLTLAVLYLCDVKVRSIGRNMKCPFHAMKGKGNLSIMPTGKIYCFDCLICLWPDEFIAKYFNLSKSETNKMINEIKHLYDSR